VRAQIVAAIVSIGLVGAGAPAVASSAEGHEDPQRVARLVTLTAGVAEAIEGDVVALRAVVKKPKQAKRIFLQRWDVPPYFGNPSWENVRSVKVRKRTTTLHEVATSLDTARYRVVVTRKQGKPLRSAPVNITVWRWIPLQKFATYSSTSGAVFGQANINGVRYKTWGAATYSNAGSWTSGFTPGRNCKAFAGVLGVDDQSDDGSSGTIALLADDVSIYQSPALTPGMSMKTQVPLALPYRFGLRATDTSPDAVDAYPVVGDPALLCTGIA
jgi:hypothetical protein